MPVTTDDATKTLCILIVSAIALIAVLGCSSDAPSPTPTPPRMSVGERTQLSDANASDYRNWNGDRWSVSNGSLRNAQRAVEIIENYLQTSCGDCNRQAGVAADARIVLERGSLPVCHKGIWEAADAWVVNTPNASYRVWKESKSAEPPSTEAEAHAPLRYSGGITSAC
mgnify:CR=1 FL=1